MCRAKTDAAFRRCPCSYGALRSQKDRARAAAKRAAGTTLTKTTTRHGGGAGVDADSAPAGPSAPSAQELRALGEQVSIDLANGWDEDVDGWKEFQAKYGTSEQAIVALGNGVAQRAEMHAGVTSADVDEHFRAMEREVATLQEDFQKRHDFDGVTAALVKRRALYDDNKDETFEQYRQAVAPLYEKHRIAREDPAYIRIQELRQAIHSPQSGEGGAMLAKLRDGYLTALAEVRPLGGEINFHAKTKDDAREAFQRAAQVFPSDWLDKSNATPLPYARISKRRAHYSSGKRIAKKKRVPIESKVFAAEDMDMTIYNHPGKEYVRDPSGDGYGDRLWIEREYNLAPKSWSTGEYIKPKNMAGWEEFTHYGQTGWRKPKFKLEEVSAERIPEITTGGARRELDDNGYNSTAVHELGHRMQHAVPGVYRAEHQFRTRRTTLADGTQERKVNVSGGAKGETGWADSFVDAYTGRDYGHGFTEVISTGGEALFAGRFGGLVGAGPAHRDDDMRSFVLGLFAGAGHPKKTA